MYPSAICRLSLLLAAGIFRASIAVGEPITVGGVDKVQAQVEATQAGQTRGLVVKSEVYFRDRCHSREGARLQATLKDGTRLTLGENATLVVDEFIYDPSMSRGALSIRVVKGAFLYVGGRIEGVNGAKVQIHTPVGAIGLRGTTVWGGPIDKGYGVIVLSGEVTVTGRRGIVTLKQGQGAMLFGDGKPRPAAAWPGGPNEARRRLNHVRKSAGSTVGRRGRCLPQRPPVSSSEARRTCVGVSRAAPRQLDRTARSAVRKLSRR